MKRSSVLKLLAVLLTTTTLVAGLTIKFAPPDTDRGSKPIELQPVKAIADTLDSKHIPSVEPRESLQGILAKLPPFEWTQLPATKLKTIIEPKSFEDPAIRAISGPKAITTAWNGAVWIEDLQRLDMVGAGGHGDYCGNDYNSFSLEQMRWFKIHGPSSMEGYEFRRGRGLNGQLGVMPDGRPASRHTYQGQVYHPPTEKIYMFGGSICSGPGTADNKWWSVTLDGNYELLGGTGRWEALGDNALYDPVTGHIFRSKRNNIQRFDVKQRQLHRLTSRGDKAWGAAAAIDPDRRTILTYGHGVAFTYNIDSRMLTDIKPGGVAGPISQIGNGLVFIEPIDRYVAWRGGNTLYIIHPETWHITSVTTAGTAPERNRNGIYGRFAFSEKYQAFIVVSAIDQDIYLLKLGKELKHDVLAVSAQN